MKRKIIIIALLAPLASSAMNKAPLIKKISIAIKNNSNESVEIKTPEQHKLEPSYKKTIEISHPDTFGYAELVTVKKDSSTVYLQLQQNDSKYTGYLKEKTGVFSLNPKVISSDFIGYTQIGDNQLKSEIVIQNDLEKSTFKFLK